MPESATAVCPSGKFVLSTGFTVMYVVDVALSKMELTRPTAHKRIISQRLDQCQNAHSGSQ